MITTGTFNYGDMDRDAYNKLFPTELGYMSYDDYKDAYNTNTSSVNTPYYNKDTGSALSPEEYWSMMEDAQARANGKTDNKKEIPKLSGYNSSISAPRVNFPNVSPRPFSPIQLTSSTPNVSGLLNSPMLNKGLIK